LELYFRMSQFEKLLERFLKRPKDFTYNELKRLLSHYDYEEIQGRGSRVAFVNKANNNKIKVHRPHPSNIVKQDCLEDVEAQLRRKGLIK